MAETPTPQEQQAAQAAAEQAAEQTAEQVVTEGGSQQEAQAAAQQAAEEEAKRVAPELTDKQIKRIADASGKAAARETIEEMRKLGVIREEGEETSPLQHTQQVPNTPTQTNPPPNPQQPPQPPPHQITQQQEEIQQEPPRKLTPAEKFVKRK